MKFDAAKPPEITYILGAVDDPRKICEFRWWGPTEAFDVVGVLAQQDRRLAVRSLRVVPHGLDVDDSADVPGEGVTPSLLRKVPLPRLIAQVHADLLATAERGDMYSGGDVPTPLWLKNLQALTPAVPQKDARKGGRPAVSEDLLRQVAVAYLAEQHAGRGLHDRIADRISQPAKRVPDLIRLARAADLLTPAAPGKRGAAPGPQLLASFRQADAQVPDETRARARRKLAQGRAAERAHKEGQQT